MAKRQQTFVEWLNSHTWGQRLGFVAGIAALVLGRDHIPTDPDTVKEWVEVAVVGFTAWATVSALLNGKKPPEDPS